MRYLETDKKIVLGVCIFLLCNSIFFGYQGIQSRNRYCKVLIDDMQDLQRYMAIHEPDSLQEMQQMQEQYEALHHGIRNCENRYNVSTMYGISIVSLFLIIILLY